LAGPRLLGLGKGVLVSSVLQEKRSKVRRGRGKHQGIVYLFMTNFDLSLIDRSPEPVFAEVGDAQRISIQPNSEDPVALDQMKFVGAAFVTRGSLLHSGEAGVKPLANLGQVWLKSVLGFGGRHRKCISAGICARRFREQVQEKVFSQSHEMSFEFAFLPG